MRISKGKFLLIFLITLIFVVLIFRQSFFEKKYQWKTGLVTSGTIEEKITANGTINPVFTVNVGTQISGIIQNVYVDYNDKVNKNQLLAKIDPALLQAKISQSKANLSAAQAVLKASKSKFFRQKQLEKKGFISQGSIEISEKDFEEARARVIQAKAQLERESRNLLYSQIISPIDGVIIERAIDVGQTVAASFQTPTLFKIARNLNEMQIEALVSEADIGKIKSGQSVKFQVDAYPGKFFSGSVNLVRLEPEVEQNVVSYKVIVNVENSEGFLLPGMTAQALITVMKRENVLLIPIASLRFSPPESLNYIDGLEVINNDQGVTTSFDDSIFKITKDGKIEKLRISTGLSDGKFIEVLDGLKESEEIIVRKKQSFNSKDSGSGFRFKLK
ncbi:MAG: efflux RND transporter periplasmic adaptor subunit [Burkholderiaceae bacterium]